MKAEHRKELETNLLADRVGRLMQRMKHRPKGRVLMYATIVVALGIGLYVWGNMRRAAQEAIAQSWGVIDVGTRDKVDRVAGFTVDKRGKGLMRVDIETESSNPNKAARLEIARYYLWELGIRQLGTYRSVGMNRDVMGETPLDKIEFAALLYDAVNRDAEGQPEWKAEALYGLAVIEETMALRSLDRLKSAQQKFKELAEDEKLKETGHGKLAQARHKEIAARFDELSSLYSELGRDLRIPTAQTKKSFLPSPQAP